LKVYNFEHKSFYHPKEESINAKLVNSLITKDVKEWIQIIFENKDSIIDKPTHTPIFRRFKTFRRKGTMMNEVSKTLKEYYILI
jgi:hypothetical protein